MQNTALADDNIVGPFLLGAAGGFIPGGSIIPGLGLFMLGMDSPTSARDTATKSFGAGMFVGTLVTAIGFGKLLFSHWFGDDDDEPDYAPHSLKKRLFSSPTFVDTMIGDIGLKLFELKFAFF
jgi:hypothetical protein